MTLKKDKYIKSTWARFDRMSTNKADFPFQPLIVFEQTNLDTNVQDLVENYLQCKFIDLDKRHSPKSIPFLSYIEFVTAILRDTSSSPTRELNEIHDLINSLKSYSSAEIEKSIWWIDHKFKFVLFADCNMNLFLDELDYFDEVTTKVL